MFHRFGPFLLRRGGMLAQEKAAAAGWLLSPEFVVRELPEQSCRLTALLEDSVWTELRSIDPR